MIGTALRFRLHRYSADPGAPFETTGVVAGPDLCCSLSDYDLRVCNERPSVGINTSAMLIVCNPRVGAAQDAAQNRRGEST